MLPICSNSINIMILLCSSWEEYITLASHLNNISIPFAQTPPRPPSALQISLHLLFYLLLHFTTLLLCPLRPSICTVIVSKGLSESLWFIERVVQTNKQHVSHCSRWCQKHEKMRKRWRRWEKWWARKHITWLQIRGQKARANYIKKRQPWFSTKGKTHRSVHTSPMLLLMARSLSLCGIVVYASIAWLPPSCKVIVTWTLAWSSSRARNLKHLQYTYTLFAFLSFTSSPWTVCVHCTVEAWIIMQSSRVVPFNWTFSISSTWGDGRGARQVTRWDMACLMLSSILSKSQLLLSHSAKHEHLCKLKTKQYMCLLCRFSVFD